MVGLRRSPCPNSARHRVRVCAGSVGVCSLDEGAVDLSSPSARPHRAGGHRRRTRQGTSRHTSRAEAELDGEGFATVFSFGPEVGEPDRLYFATLFANATFAAAPREVLLGSSSTQLGGNPTMRRAGDGGASEQRPNRSKPWFSKGVLWPHIGPGTRFGDLISARPWTLARRDRAEDRHSSESGRGRSRAMADPPSTIVSHHRTASASCLPLLEGPCVHDFFDLRTRGQTRSTSRGRKVLPENPSALFWHPPCLRSATFRESMIWRIHCSEQLSGVCRTPDSLSNTRQERFLGGTGVDSARS